MNLSPYCQPVVTCRCCGKVVRAEYQPGLGSKPSYWLITCMNQNCGLYYYTFGTPDYARVSLTPYLKANARTWRTGLNAGQ